MGDQKVEVIPEKLAGKSAWFSGFFMHDGEQTMGSPFLLKKFSNTVLFGTVFVD